MSDDDQAITSPASYWLAGLGALYLLADAAARYWVIHPGVSVWYPAAGVALAMLLVFGMRSLLLLVALTTLVMFLSFDFGLPRLSLLISALAKALVYGAAAWVLLTRLSFDPRLSTTRDILAITGAGLLAPLVLAIVWVAEQHYFAGGAQSGFIREVFIFWLGDAIGVMTVAPLLVMVLTRKAADDDPAGRLPGWPVLLAQLMAIGTAVAVAFALYPTLEVSGYYWCLLPLILIAYRWGLANGAAAALTTNVTAVVAMILTGTTAQDLIAVQTFLLLATLATLYLGTAADQARRSLGQKQALASANARAARILETGQIVPWEADATSWRFTFIGSQAETIFGYPVDRWQDADFWVERLHPDDREWVVDECKQEAAAGRDYSLEYRMRAADGRYLWIRDVVSTSTQDGHQMLQGFMIDITERHNVQDSLARKSLYDPLTGLANQALLLDRLTEALKQPGGQQVSLLMLDIDAFRHVNNAHGYGVGDSVLRSVANRLGQLLIGGESAARIAGDAFAVMSTGATSAVRIGDLANKIHEDFKQPFDMVEAQPTISASIGLVDSRESNQGADRLLQDGEIARARAKQMGGGKTCTFKAQMRQRITRQVVMKTQLAKAIEDKQLEVHYQPIWRLADNRLAGFEALVRWQHPERGLLMPGSFLDVARQSGLMSDIDGFVLTTACADLARWRDRSGDEKLSLSVNLSSQRAVDPDLTQHVAEMLATYDLPPNTLALELTETTLVEKPVQTSNTLKALRARGVSIHVDDFGTGYSSLVYLHQFPVSLLKIDQVFIAGMQARKNREIIRAVIDLCRRLDITVTAEGIESESQLERLRDWGCTYGQGFLLGRPMSPVAAQDLAVECLANRQTTA